MVSPASSYHIIQLRSYDIIGTQSHPITTHAFSAWQLVRTFPTWAFKAIPAPHSDGRKPNFQVSVYSCMIYNPLAPCQHCPFVYTVVHGMQMFACSARQRKCPSPHSHRRKETCTLKLWMEVDLPASFKVLFTQFTMMSSFAF